MADDIYWADEVEPIFKKAVKKKESAKYAILMGSKKKASATDFKVEDETTAWDDIVEYIDFNMNRGESYFMIHIVTSSKDRYPFEIPVGQKPTRRGASMAGTQYMTGAGMGFGGQSSFDRILELTGKVQDLKNQMALEKTTGELKGQLGQVKGMVEELQNSTMLERALQNPVMAPKIFGYMDRGLNFLEKRLLPEEQSQAAIAGNKANTAESATNKAPTENKAPEPQAAQNAESDEVLRDKKAAFDSWTSLQKSGMKNAGQTMQAFSMMYLKDPEGMMKAMTEFAQKQQAK